jgi:hypothetical protein
MNTALEQFEILLRTPKDLEQLELQPDESSTHLLVMCAYLTTMSVSRPHEQQGV